MAMGFCFFNNAAVAARAAQQVRGRVDCCAAVQYGRAALQHTAALVATHPPHLWCLKPAHPSFNMLQHAPPLPQAGAQRVLILDWDIHHGNGTQVGRAGGLWF